MKSLFEEWRSTALPELPSSLQKLSSLQAIQQLSDGYAKNSWQKSLFPHLSRRSPVSFIPRTAPSAKKRVGVILSGGQAPGGHNVIAGLLHSLQKQNLGSSLIGFLGGVKGLIENKTKELPADLVDSYLNSGGFEMIGSGRTKLETEADFSKAIESLSSHNLSGCVIIGGDDSNTNAAFLAEALLKRGSRASIIGVPKTIDGDFRNDHIEMNFGFDTATKIYSETIGNLVKDLLSQRKYWFFVKLMGRSASHIALECALTCHPNLTLISEEMRPLNEILQEMKTVIEKRARSGRNFGLILIPEGIVENFPEWKEGALHDPHGNVEVSKLETEKRFIEEVKKILDPAIPFSPLPFFLGYEGRSAAPTLFDAHLGYALGTLSAHFIEESVTGVIASIKNLSASVKEWQIHAEPMIALLHEEERKGKKTIVMQKKLVELSSTPYKTFLHDREQWKWEDSYYSPGPIQYSGPHDLIWQPPKILA